MNTSQLKAWLLGGGILLSACEPVSPKPFAPVIVAVTANSDGTKLVTRKVNGMLEGRTLVYQSTGEIADIFYFHHDKLEGIQRRFHPNGRLASWKQYHQNRLNGKSYSFFENGGIANIEQYVDDRRTGPNMQFYAHSTNRIHTYLDLVVAEGIGSDLVEWQRRYISYDTLGRVIGRYGFPQVHALRDTISVGDSLVLRMQIRYPQFPVMFAVVGNFDARFHLIDSTAMQIVPARPRIATVRILATRRGQQVVRGYLGDFQKTEHSTQKGKTAVEGQRLYFTYPYYVR